MPKGAGQRIVTGLVAAAVVVTACFALPSDLWLLVALGVVLGAQVELAGLLRKWLPGISRPALFALFLAETAFACAAIRGDLAVGPPLAILALSVGLVLVPGGVALGSAATPREVPLHLVLLSFGPLYLALPLAAVYGLHRLDPWWMFLLMAIVSVGDSLAWACGSAWGRHKLAPSISPKKSWEGAIAGLVGSLAAVAIFGFAFFGRIDPVLLALGGVAAVAGQIGDLVESMFKRGVGVKDSSRILPGHGGILDRIDAVLLAGPVLYGGLAWAGFGALP